MKTTDPTLDSPGSATWSIRLKRFFFWIFRLLLDLSKVASYLGMIPVTVLSLNKARSIHILTVQLP